jgi:hypothetical protein
MGWDGVSDAQYANLHEIAFAHARASSQMLACGETGSRFEKICIMVVHTEDLTFGQTRVTGEFKRIVMMYSPVGLIGFSSVTSIVPNSMAMGGAGKLQFFPACVRRGYTCNDCY